MSTSGPGPPGRRHGTRARRPADSGAEPARNLDFPVVAIGASAGGLEAFRILLRELPAKGGMAYMLVQHLDPTHASMMVELLAPHAAMKIVEAVEGTPIEPDHIYVIPPGRYLSLRHGALRLSSPPGRPAVRMPFDFLLESLAEDCGDHAVCVILSGTAADGAAGAKAIKAAGGLVIAQDPDEAEYDGMPRNAIRGGAVDLVLPLSRIPGALADYAGHRYLQGKGRGADVTGAEAYAQIIELLHKRTAHDFSLYKPGTMERRIERRMALNGVSESQAYLELLTRDAAELQRLADDLLINVTRFFRDEAAFELLSEQVLPDLVRQHPPDQPIRVWVAGCSTGEEAYSICMLLLEAIAKAQRSIRLQIFATDVDAEAVAVAREGLYPPTIEADVSPDRLARFFVREETGYRATRELRSPIVFSVHDLVSDAPFSRLDMVSCRNLLIYLRPEVQQKVVGLFHFALGQGAVLILGGSETVGAAGDRFEPISKTQRIYRHIGRSRPGDVELPLGRGEAARTLWARPPRQPAGPRPGVGDFAQRLLLETYAPASILVGRRHEGVYYSGPTDLYLKMPTGEASLDVLAAAREGLRPAIRTAIERAAQQPEAVTVAGRVKRDGVSTPVSVTARAVTNADEDLILLSFADLPQSERSAEALPEPQADTSRAARLEEELDNARRDLEAAIRDRDIAEEEIRAINEEAMSVNEEFQTTNEELETSHEELQSLNEELTALNGQLQEALDQQRSTADDLQNILNSSDVATIFLDDRFRIRFFTPAAKALFSVIASDIGRPLADLAHHFSNEALLSDARAVLSSLVPTVREVEAESGAWYNCRTLPYRTKDNRIEGVVITFADVSVRKRAEEVANTAKLLAESANLGKSRFLAAASHDLRQPLQTLSLLNGLLERKVKDKDTLDLVARGGEALMAMSGMLNTLLDINQLEAGVVRPEIVDFPIADLLEPLRTEFAYHAQSKGVGWRVTPCRLAVRSDPRLLGQMVRNLLSNAVKYTKKGRLVLGCRRRGDKLRIEVWDTGLGIPEAQLRAIFEEFHQIDNPARELSRGLGLGLAIVQRLGDLLGHAVDVRSREGRGSVFSIEVPLSPAGARLVEKGPSTALPAPAARSGTILIVEDDPALRESLALFATTNGHVAEIAADGADAIRLVERKGLRPDLVIVDHNLPDDLSGLEVLARLQQTLGPGLPAIVLTGDISTATLRDIAAKGYEHRTKPASADDLTRLIRRLLSVAPPGTAAPGPSPRTVDAGQEGAIFLVDDDPSVRQAMRDLLKANGRQVEDYGSAEDFLASYRPDAQGILLVDATMPGMGGLALLDRLRRDGARLPAIVVTGNGDVRMAVQALRAGAADFIEKPVGEAALLDSIDLALARAADSPPQSASRSAAAARFAGLTARQRRILDMVLAGQPSKNIAADLGISQRTVDAHRAAIMKKSGARTLTELVRLAVAAG
jgi:two-component system CheB/CheR fusion protein